MTEMERLVEKAFEYRQTSDGCPAHWQQADFHCPDCFALVLRAVLPAVLTPSEAALEEVREFASPAPSRLVRGAFAARLREILGEK